MVSDRAVAFIGLVVLSIILAISASCASAPSSMTGDRYLRIVNGSSHNAQVWYRRGSGVWRLSYPLGLGQERQVRLPAGALNGGSGVVFLGVEFTDGLFDSPRSRFDWALQGFVPRPCYETEVRIGPFPADISPTGREEWIC